MRSWALPASACPGGGGILGCVPGPCAPGVWAVGFALPAAQLPPHGASSSPSELLPPRSPLRGAAPDPPELLRVPQCALQPLGSSAHLPGRRCLLVSPGPEGIPALLGPAPTPREPLSAWEGRCSSCFSGTGLSCPGDTRPGLSPSPRGALPPWRPFVSLFLFPRLPTLIEARTLLTVAFQLVSL